MSSFNGVDNVDLTGIQIQLNSIMAEIQKLNTKIDEINNSLFYNSEDEGE